MTKILFSDAQPPRAQAADRDETVREALALLPARDAAGIVAEARRHAIAGTIPDLPARSPGDAIRVPPTWAREWEDAPGGGRWLVPLHVARWWLVAILIDVTLFDADPDRLRAFCEGYRTILAAKEEAAAPGARLDWALATFYGNADADRFREVLAPLPVELADAVADEALRIMEAEAVPGMPYGVAEGPVAIVARWRCDLADALLRADAEAVRRAVDDFGNVLGAAGARLFDPRGWPPLVAVPFREVET